MFPWLIVISEFDAFANGGMVGPEDQKESTAFGREFGLSIPDEYQRIGVILMSQFKAKAVGFVFDMPSDQIEKRQKCEPEAGTRSAEMTPSRKVRRSPGAGEPVDGGAAHSVGEPKSDQQEASDVGQGRPVVTHDVMLQFVTDGEFDLVG